MADNKCESSLTLLILLFVQVILFIIISELRGCACGLKMDVSLPDSEFQAGKTKPFREWLERVSTEMDIDDTRLQIYRGHVYDTETGLEVTDEILDPSGRIIQTKAEVHTEPVRRQETFYGQTVSERIKNARPGQTRLLQDDTDQITLDLDNFEDDVQGFTTIEKVLDQKKKSLRVLEQDELLTEFGVDNIKTHYNLLLEEIPVIESGKIESEQIKAFNSYLNNSKIRMNAIWKHADTHHGIKFQYLKDRWHELKYQSRYLNRLWNRQTAYDERYIPLDDMAKMKRGWQNLGDLKSLHGRPSWIGASAWKRWSHAWYNWQWKHGTNLRTRYSRLQDRINRHNTYNSEYKRVRFTPGVQTSTALGEVYTDAGVRLSNRKSTFRDVVIQRVGQPLTEVAEQLGFALADYVYKKTTGHFDVDDIPDKEGWVQDMSDGHLWYQDIQNDISRSLYPYLYESNNILSNIYGKLNRMVMEIRDTFIEQKRQRAHVLLRESQRLLEEEDNTSPVRDDNKRRKEKDLQRNEKSYIWRSYQQEVTLGSAQEAQTMLQNTSQG